MHCLIISIRALLPQISHTCVYVVVCFIIFTENESQAKNKASSKEKKIDFGKLKA